VTVRARSRARSGFQAPEQPPAEGVIA